MSADPRCLQTNHRVKLHKIPNMSFARWGIRNEIRIFFPGLYSPGERENHKVHNAETAMFFENVTRIALNRLMPGLRGTNLPPNLSAELWRARNPNGSFEFGGRTVSEAVAAELGDELRVCLEEACGRGVALDWARDFFFLHQIRGVKDSNAHSYDDAGQAFIQFVDENHLSFDEIFNNPESWRIDYGCELSSANGEDTLAWREDSHGSILEEVFQIPRQHANRMTRVGSSSYTKDPTSHMTEVAGFRVVPGEQGRGPFSITKVQAYQTDKALTASKGDGQGRSSKTYSLKHNFARTSNCTFFADLYSVCEDAIEAGVVSNARVEARVPVSSLDGICQTFHHVNWRKFVVKIECKEWW